MALPSHTADSLDSYELGYKAQFPEQLMTLEASAFYLNWKDMQLLTEINGFNVTGNAGAARSTGLELAWTWRPGSYTNAEMTSDAPQIGAKSGDQLPDSPNFVRAAPGQKQTPTGRCARNRTCCTPAMMGSWIPELHEDER